MSDIPEMDAIISSVGVKLFPALDAAARKCCDDAYEAIITATQDYLVDNAQFNIGSRISMLEGNISRLEAERGLLQMRNDAMLVALSGLKDILDRAESNASGNMEWDHVSARVNAARAALKFAGGEVA